MLIRPVYLLRQVLALRARTVLAAVAALVLLALALLPFLLVYLPKASETGMHSYSAAFSYLLQPYDILNIGEHNYLYGRFLPALHEAIGFPIQFSENQMGLPPVLLLVFLCGGFLALRNVRDVRAQLILILTLAALALWVLALKVGDQSGWYWIYHYFPGAKAVRVVSRSMIFLVFPVLCVALYFLSSFKGRSAWLLILPCCALLVAEELNWLGAVHLERAAAVRMLESVPRAPADCRSFFVQDMRPPGPLESAGEREYYRHNVEAMLIAEYIHLPTVNGYSSFNPPDWNFNAADRPDYAARVAAYSKVHQIQGLCALDLQTRSWSLPGR